jgi:hypothetical protein
MCTCLQSASSGNQNPFKDDLNCTSLVVTILRVFWGWYGLLPRHTKVPSRHSRIFSKSLDLKKQLITYLRSYLKLQFVNQYFELLTILNSVQNFILWHKRNISQVLKQITYHILHSNFVINLLLNNSNQLLLYQALPSCKQHLKTNQYIE